MEGDRAEPGPELTDGAPEVAKWVLTTDDEAHRADALLRQAQVARIRDEVDKAGHLVAEAYQQAPHYSPAVVAYTDELVARGRAGDAVRLLEGAIATSPPSLELDGKRAELVLRTRFHEADFLDLESERANFASAKTAVFLSILLPGLGHMALERYARGGVIMAAWLLGIGGVFLVPNGVRGLEGLLRANASAAFNPLVLLPVIVALGAFAVAVAETSQEAKKAVPLTIARPKPPVDKPF